MTIKEKLCLIQNEMKVPKNLYNSFGKYNYRNAETILETAKPICLKYKATLTVYDTIQLVGERYYIKAVAELHDWESDELIENQAFAREEESKKGMDSSQVTGATSSYARKYALNGLFCLDDVKDADTDEFKKQTTEMKNEKEEYTKAIARLKAFCAKKNLKLADVMQECKITRDSNSEYINGACDRLEKYYAGKC